MLPLRARVDLGAMAMKRYSAFSKALVLLEPCTIRLFSVIYRTFVGRVLFLGRDAVDVFCCPSRLGNRLGHSLWESYSFAEMQSVYSYSSSRVGNIFRTFTVGVLLLCRDAVGVFYSSSRVGNIFRTFTVGVLLLCRDAVGVFYSSSRVGNIFRTFTVGVLLLCRDAVGVFYSSSRVGNIFRTFTVGVLLLCRDAVSVFSSSSRLGHRTLIGGVLLPCRDAVGVFCCPSRLEQKDLGIKNKYKQRTFA